MRTIVTENSPVSSFDRRLHDMDFFGSSKAWERFYIELADEICVEIETKKSFAQLAWYHIRRKKLNKSAFQTLTLLSGRTFKRLENNNVPQPSLETAMAVAIGLGLGEKMGMELVERAGYKLEGPGLNLIYRKLLTVFVGQGEFKGKGVFECNAVLVALGCEPLCKKEYHDLLSRLE